MINIIKLTAKQIQDLYTYEGDDANEHSHAEYQGWYILADTSDGEFDAEKGAMTDYKLSLYNNEDELIGVGYGGYYTGVTGHSFNYDVEFFDNEPTETYELTDLEVRAISAMAQFISNGNIGAEAIEGYEDLTNDEAWEGLQLIQNKF